MFQALSTELKYSGYNNQQLAMALGLLINRIRSTRTPEAWIYIKAIVNAEMEDYIKDLQEPIPLTNTLRKTNDKKKSSGGRRSKTRNQIPSEGKETPQ